MTNFPSNALEARSARDRDLTKGRSLACMVLDKSPSMDEGTRTIDLLEGCADFLEELREAKREVHIAFDQFAGAGQYTKAPFTPVQDAEYLSQETYRPNGAGTAIFDAIWRAVSHMEEVKRSQDQAIVAVFTDGEENCSRTHSLSDTAALIARKKAEGWIFIFAGPGRQMAKSLGVDPKFRLELRGNNVRALIAELADTVVRALLPPAGVIEL